MKRLDKDPLEKERVIQFEGKLQSAGYVEYVHNLPSSQQELIYNVAMSHYLAWHVVHNENSATTDTRMVFNGSAVTSSGYSLNDILPKGINMLNSLLEIFLRWRTWPVAMHADARKMYNTIKLNPDFWRYQIYFWDPDLDSSKHPVTKVIKTLIYGVRPSGNQAQVALRLTAEKQRDKYPVGADAIISDTYMDDCATGATCAASAHHKSTQISDLLAGGGFSVKGFTISGEPPLPSLTKDGVSVNVAGVKWFPVSVPWISTRSSEGKLRGQQTQYLTN